MTVVFYNTDDFNVIFFVNFSAFRARMLLALSFFLWVFVRVSFVVLGLPAVCVWLGGFPITSLIQRLCLCGSFAALNIMSFSFVSTMEWELSVLSVPCRIHPCSFNLHLHLA